MYVVALSAEGLSLSTRRPLHEYSVSGPDNGQATEGEPPERQRDGGIEGESGWRGVEEYGWRGVEEGMNE